MTSSVTDIDPGFRAWQRVEYNPTSASLTDRRAAAIYAATQTARNPKWLTFARSARIYDSIPSSLAAMQRIDAAWEELVEACGMGFGPRMASALDALIEGRWP